MLKFLRSADPWVEHLRDNPGNNTVTLIPGTWGHGKWNVVVTSRLPWRTNGAPFSNTGNWFDIDGNIAATLGLEPFNVHVLRWSERNWVSDRRRAATVLKSHLDECIRLNPDAEHCVIAHSHGGNIAAMAFAQMEEVAGLKKIHFAAMSTPFIWFHVRGASKGITQSVRFLGGIVGLSALGFGILAANGFGHIMPDHISMLSSRIWHFVVMSTQVIVGVIVFLLVCLPAVPVDRLEKKLPAVLSEAEKMSSSKIMKKLGSVLILQAPADEAWLGLTIPAFWMWLNRGMGGILSSASKLLVGLFWIAVGGLCVFFAYSSSLRRLGPQYFRKRPMNPSSKVVGEAP